jgi:hypothetical protein
MPSCYDLCLGMLLLPKTRCVAWDLPEILCVGFVFELCCLGFGCKLFVVVFVLFPLFVGCIRCLLKRCTLKVYKCIDSSKQKENTNLRTKSN